MKSIKEYILEAIRERQNPGIIIILDCGAMNGMQDKIDDFISENEEYTNAIFALSMDKLKKIEDSSDLKLSGGRSTDLSQCVKVINQMKSGSCYIICDYMFAADKDVIQQITKMKFTVFMDIVNVNKSQIDKLNKIYDDLCYADENNGAPCISARN